MSKGLERTFELLAKTGNEAAVDLLIPALDSPHRTIQEGAFAALLDRRCPAAQREFVARWDKLTDRWKSLLAKRPGRISSAIREALLGPEEELADNGSEAAVELREFELIPALVNAAEDRDHPRSNLAATTLLTLSETLAEELDTPRDYRERRDPQLMRRNVLASLANSMERFDAHRRHEVLESFLLLSTREHPVMKKMLASPHLTAYQPMVETLTTSPRAGLMRLLLKFLDDPSTPGTILNVIARRHDIPFLRRLASKSAGELSDQVRRNLQRIDSLEWSSGDLTVLHALNESEQAEILDFVWLTGIAREAVLHVTSFLLQEGNVGGRRAAIERLKSVGGVETNSLVVKAVDDEDPEVQAAALSQLRSRSIPGALKQLLPLVDSPHAEVRRAAQICLAEFNVSRYFAAFEMLEPEVRKTTGMLVRKIDGDAIEFVRTEFESESRIRRLRVLEAVAAMGLTPQFEPQVLETLSKGDPHLRAAAAETLGHCPTDNARRALRRALADHDDHVQSIAQHALQRLAQLGEEAVNPLAVVTPPLPDESLV